MARPIITTQFTPDREDAAVYLRRTWKGPALVMGDNPGIVIRTDAPDRATVPLGDNPGRLERELAATNLRRLAPYVADVYVVQVLSPSGHARYGMFAVPQATKPTLGCW